MSRRVSAKIPLKIPLVRALVVRLLTLFRSHTFREETMPLDQKPEYFKCVVALMAFWRPNKKFTMETQFRQDDFVAITPSI